VALGIHAMTLAALGAFSLLERRWPAKSPWRTFPDRPSGSVPLWAGIGIAVGIAACIAAPWFIMVHHRVPTMLGRTLDHDLVSRLFSPKGVDGQARPPGFYLLTVWGTFFPWSLLLPAIITWGWTQRHRPFTRFTFAAVVGPWLMFECFVSKMPHWFLPMLAPLAVLAAQWLVDCLHGKRKDLTTGGMKLAIGLWLLATLMMAGTVVAGAIAYPPGDWVGTLTLTIWLAAWGSVTAGLLLLLRPVAGFIAMGSGMAVTIVLLYTVWAPRTWYLQLPRELGADLVAAGADEKDESKMIGFREPSMAWYQGGTIREDENGALLPRKGPAFFVVSQENFDDLPPSAKAMYSIVSTRRGVVYAQSRKVKTVLLIRREAATGKATP
jgi:4-amino-4-deoxy-L-arabinose transferase-like glycosyltransferase